MNVLVEIVGLDKMQRKLDEISMGSSRALRQGCLHTAQRIERTAKMLCPVRTGYLRSSIRSDTLGEDGAYASAGGSYRGTHGALRDIDYAVYVNYGTKKMAARPFFTNAVDMNLPYLFQDVQAEVDKLLHTETV